MTRRVRSVVRERFQRRYPTPAERLAYVRQAYRRWTRLVEANPATGNPLDGESGGLVSG